MSCRWWLLAAALLAAPGAFAQSQYQPMSLERLDLLPRDAGASTAITPVYSQIVMFSLPDNFKTLPAVKQKAHFAQQSIPTNETGARWTQMITLSGDEAMAFSGRTWPQQMVETFAARIKRSCPESYGELPIKAYVASFDTAVVVAGCGSAPGHGGSEATLQLVVKGGMDMYTLEWTVRGPATRGPLKLDEAQWTERLRTLSPIKICRSEAAPYPNCTRRR